MAVLASEPVNVVLDLTDLLYVDSAGLAVVLGPLLRFTDTDTGKVAIAGLHGTVERVFQMMGLTSVFGSYRTVGDVLRDTDGFVRDAEG